ncbi:DUF5947 family protein [Carbonactinospora thermoautotrophica]|uniref:DUF5947 family protein n=1 Tax=Carbonactinospora thermoautotrophica TaxID=1469144 RepID=UPI0027E18247|nr:DUF5947 family protein [Carbonactinospora thermoautotrophica]
MSDGLDILRRFTRPPPRVRPGERCEMCGEPLGEEHPHVVDVEQRGLLCTCRPCYLLFSNPGAGRGRYRAVPDRYRYDAAFALTDAQWDELQIPVGMAFFLINSALERVIAFYPSPAGATESRLPLATWQAVAGANVLAAELEPDVEALLVRRREGGYESYLVPVDACYELVGRIRLHWRGFDGGTQAHTEIDRFFARLRERSRKEGAP